MIGLINDLLGYDLAAQTDPYLASAASLLFLFVAVDFMIHLITMFFGWLFGKR